MFIRWMTRFGEVLDENVDGGDVVWEEVEKMARWGSSFVSGIISGILFRLPALLFFSDLSASVRADSIGLQRSATSRAVGAHS